jgi:hypothetical protein
VHWVDRVLTHNEAKGEIVLIIDNSFTAKKIYALAKGVSFSVKPYLLKEQQVNYPETSLRSDHGVFSAILDKLKYKVVVSPVTYSITKCTGNH